VNLLAEKTFDNVSTFNTSDGQLAIALGADYPPVRVVREVHAELVVHGSLVLGIGVGQDRDDVLELAHQCLDLGLRELAAGRLAADLPL
jgi:hypothetical protein